MSMFDNMNNPWALGGQKASRLPWEEQSRRFLNGGKGNDFFHPKTKEQVRNEALLQLAVVAAVIAAPAIAGALGASAAAGGASAAGMGASAQAAGAAVGQGVVAAGSSGAASSIAGGLIGGSVAYAALQPFMNKAENSQLLDAARMGLHSLRNEIERRHKECNCPPTPKFRTAEWEQKYGDCNCDDVSSAQGAQTRRNAFNSLRLLETLSELIQREPQLERALKKVDPCKPQCEANGLPRALKQRLFKQVGEAALPLMREAYVWEGGEEKNSDGTYKIEKFNEAAWRRALNTKDNYKLDNYYILNTSLKELKRVYLPKGYVFKSISESGETKNTVHVIVKHPNEQLPRIFIIPSKYAIDSYPEIEDFPIPTDTFFPGDTILPNDTIPRDTTVPPPPIGGIVLTKYEPVTFSIPLEIKFENTKSYVWDGTGEIYHVENKRQLEWLAWFLVKHPEFQVALQGWSDGGGAAGEVSREMKESPTYSRPKNWMELAYKRSNIIKKELVTIYQVPSWQITLLDPVVNPNSIGYRPVLLHVKGILDDEAKDDYNQLAKALGYPLAE